MGGTSREDLSLFSSEQTHWLLKIFSLETFIYNRTFRETSNRKKKDKL